MTTRSPEASPAEEINLSANVVNGLDAKTASEEIILLPCPFCGADAHEARYFSADTVLFWVKCSTCPANMRGFDQSEADAVEAWNTRAAAIQCDNGDPCHLPQCQPHGCTRDDSRFPAAPAAP